VITQIASWAPVERVEPSLEIPVEVERGGVRHPTILSGLAPNSELRRLTDESGRKVAPGRGEALLGRLLRDKLGVGEGDLVRIHYAQNRREFKITTTVRVGPEITQPVGSMVYMGMDEVQRLFANRLGYPLNAVSAALIQTKDGQTGWLRERLERMPTVASVQTQTQTHEQIQEMLKFTQAFMGVIAFFGVGLAFAVVFTSVSISVLERTRELATLRTLGYGLRRIAWFITVENLLIAAVGIAAGIPLGRWLDFALVRASQTESFTMEPVIFARTYVIAIIGVLLLTLLAQLPSFVYVRRLNLAAATKELGG
jgi:putative ABC transport system permease protein